VKAVAKNSEHRTSNAERGMNGAGQRKGCLPVGFTEESWLSVSQFCRWRQRSDRWFRKHRREIPGLLGEHKDAQVHVGAHLRGVFPGLSKHF